jgi:thermitase
MLIRGRRRWLVCAVGLIVVALAGLAVVAGAAPMAAQANDFPAGSLALGRPMPRSEDYASEGTVKSIVPAPARAAADELLVAYRAGTSASDRKAVRVRAGVILVGALIDLPIDLVAVRSSHREQAIARLRRDPEVRSVQPDTVESDDYIDCSRSTACMVPNDPGFSRQWYLYNAPGVLQPPGSSAGVPGADVAAPFAWRLTLGSSAVRIAIIDTGIDAAQPDLAGKVVAAANFTASAGTNDLAGHGTHVAGIAAAAFNNVVGIAGVAPRARLMDIKVLAVDAGGHTTGDCADVADGIAWAVDHGANVLNLSLGSPTPCNAMALAIDYAYSNGALVVAAAGNDASTSRFYPAAYDHVISVAATDNRDQPAAFSNVGAGWVDVAAPGVGIVSTLPTYDNATGAIDYGYMSGTSMAAPIVSGIAALIWDGMPAGHRSQEVADRIFASATPLPGTGTDWRYGRVDACLAVTGNAALCPPQPPASAPVDQQPAPPPPPTAQPAAIGGPPPADSRRTAVPGAYNGSLGRRGLLLRLTVGASGDSLTRLLAVVRLSCRGGPSVRVRITGLSTTDYGRIARSGTFTFALRKTSTSIREQRLAISGRFAPTRQARGTLRVTGRTRTPASGCRSRTIRWNIRLTHAEAAH